ncbi:MAG: RDD family protein [Flavobacterium sp.]
MENTNLKPNLTKRFLAGLIDYAIIYAFFYAFISAFGEPNEEGGYSVTGFLALVPILFWFVFLVVFETFFGATLGNSIVGLRPKSLTKNNGELSLGQSIKRHVLDPIDMFPFGLLGIMAIINTDRNQRIGDIWAKTIVVEAKQN